MRGRRERGREGKEGGRNEGIILDSSLSLLHHIQSGLRSRILWEFRMTKPQHSWPDIRGDGLEMYAQFKQIKMM
jgi:hypothetical protein